MGTGRMLPRIFALTRLVLSCNFLGYRLCFDFFFVRIVIFGRRTAGYGSDMYLHRAIFWNCLCWWSLARTRITLDGWNSMDNRKWMILWAIWYCAGVIWIVEFFFECFHILLNRVHCLVQVDAGIRTCYVLGMFTSKFCQCNNPTNGNDSNQQIQCHSVRFALDSV